jgi:hypothetical protein
MPTPFSHLALAQRLLADPALGEPDQQALSDELPAFLLGSIAADARVESGMPREATHFYDYTQDLGSEAPWRRMIESFPGLTQPETAAQRAFVAGYVGHLAMDEIWSRQMLAPHFVQRDWATRAERWVMLHVILIVMDERDYPKLEPWQHQALSIAAPQSWVPFMSDLDLTRWRDLIDGQIAQPDASQTLTIFGSRAGLTPPQLRALLDDPDAMHQRLWAHIPHALLENVESAIYAYALSQVQDYLALTQAYSAR